MAWIDYRKAYDDSTLVDHRLFRFVWNCDEYNVFPEQKNGGVEN